MEKVDLGLLEEDEEFPAEGLYNKNKHLHFIYILI